MFLIHFQFRPGRFAFKRNQRVESLVSPKRQAAQTWPPFSLAPLSQAGKWPGPALNIGDPVFSGESRSCPCMRNLAEKELNYFQESFLVVLTSDRAAASGS
jgi:hypothetical protein